MSQLSKGSLKEVQFLNVLDMSVTLEVFQLSKGLLKIVQSLKIPEISVIVLISHAFTIPLKESQPENIFLKLVTPLRSGAAIASKFRFSHP